MYTGMRRYLLALGAGTVLLVLGGAAAQAVANTDGGGLRAPRNGVRAKPVTGTPHFSVTHAKPIEQIRQLVQCGGTMYAVGSFSRILHGSSSYSRHNLFSFKATAPFTVTSRAPRVNGTVNSLTFLHGKCSRAYIGGSFSSVNGTRVKNLAEIRTSTGAVV